jgi:hypothetical protein
MPSTDLTIVPTQPKRPRIRRWLLGAAIALVVVVLGFYISYRRTYPYGWSHCCDLILSQALQAYADNHNGAFPNGGQTPEASLSLLYSNVDFVTPDLLRGRTVPEAVVKESLKRDGRLGPDSCGWHYVEGLRVDDDPGLAIFWDKIGLGHNGQRLSRPGHTVLFIGRDRRFIPESDWQTFLSEQTRLLQQRTNAVLGVSGTIEVGGEQVRAELRVLDDGLYGRVWHGWMNTSSELLANMDREPEEGVVGIPVVTRDEVRKATAVVDSNAKSIRFLLGNRECVFDGSSFRFVTR